MKNTIYGMFQEVAERNRGSVRMIWPTFFIHQVLREDQKVYLSQTEMCVIM